MELFYILPKFGKLTSNKSCAQKMANGKWAAVKIRKEF